MTTTITTATDLDALPIGSVVLMARGGVAERVESDGLGDWAIAGVSGRHPLYPDDGLAVTVLHVPGQPAPAVTPGRKEILGVLTDFNKALITDDEAIDAVLALLPGWDTLRGEGRG